MVFDTRQRSVVASRSPAPEPAGVALIDAAKQRREGSPLTAAPARYFGHRQLIIPPPPRAETDVRSGDSPLVDVEDVRPARAAHDVTSIGAGIQDHDSLHVPLHIDIADSDNDDGDDAEDDGLGDSSEWSADGGERRAAKAGASATRAAQEQTLLDLARQEIEADVRRAMGGVVVPMHGPHAAHSAVNVTPRLPFSLGRRAPSRQLVDAKPDISLAGIANLDDDDEEYDEEDRRNARFAQRTSSEATPLSSRRALTSVTAHSVTSTPTSIMTPLQIQLLQQHQRRKGSAHSLHGGVGGEGDASTVLQQRKGSDSQLLFAHRKRSGASSAAGSTRTMPAGAAGLVPRPTVSGGSGSEHALMLQHSTAGVSGPSSRHLSRAGLSGHSPGLHGHALPNSGADAAVPAMESPLGDAARPPLARRKDSSPSVHHSGIVMPGRKMSSFDGRGGSPLLRRTSRPLPGDSDDWPDDGGWGSSDGFDESSDDGADYDDDDGGDGATRRNSDAWRESASGTLHLGGGITMTAGGIKSIGRQRRGGAEGERGRGIGNRLVRPAGRSGGLAAELVLLDRAGVGAAGIVFRALHVPSLSLVAVKQVHLSDDGSGHRQAMAAEIKALYANMAPLPRHPPQRSGSGVMMTVPRGSVGARESALPTPVVIPAASRESPAPSAATDTGVLKEAVVAAAAIPEATAAQVVQRQRLLNALKRQDSMQSMNAALAASALHDSPTVDSSEGSAADFSAGSQGGAAAPGLARAAPIVLTEGGPPLPVKRTSTSASSSAADDIVSPTLRDSYYSSSGQSASPSVVDGSDGRGRARSGSSRVPVPAPRAPPPDERAPFSVPQQIGPSSAPPPTVLPPSRACVDFLVALPSDAEMGSPVGNMNLGRPSVDAAHACRGNSQLASGVVSATNAMEERVPADAQSSTRKHSLTLSETLDELMPYKSSAKGSTNDGGAAAAAVTAAVGLASSSSHQAAAVPVVCPYVVQFYDAYSDADAGTVNIVMEWCGGGTLQDVMDACGGLRDERALARVAAHVLRGLAFLHSNRQLHRDVKPDNVLVGGGPSRGGDFKLADFGIATQLGDGAAAFARTWVGTTLYMSPERLGGATGSGYSYPSDVWSVGLTLLALANGRFPYEAAGGDGGAWEVMKRIRDAPAPLHVLDSPSNASNTVGEASATPSAPFTAAFRAFLARALAKAPSERATVDELLHHPWLVSHAHPPRSHRKSSAAPDMLTCRVGCSLRDALVGSLSQPRVASAVSYQARAASAGNLRTLPRVPGPAPSSRMTPYTPFERLAAEEQLSLVEGTATLARFVLERSWDDFVRAFRAPRDVGDGPGAALADWDSPIPTAAELRLTTEDARPLARQLGVPAHTVRSRFNETVRERIELITHSAAHPTAAYPPHLSSVGSVSSRRRIGSGAPVPSPLRISNAPSPSVSATHATHDTTVLEGSPSPRPAALLSSPPGSSSHARSGSSDRSVPASQSAAVRPLRGSFSEGGAVHSSPPPRAVDTGVAHVAPAPLDAAMLGTLFRVTGRSRTLPTSMSLSPQDGTTPLPPSHATAHAAALPRYASLRDDADVTADAQSIHAAMQHPVMMRGGSLSIQPVATTPLLSSTNHSLLTPGGYGVASAAHHRHADNHHTAHSGSVDVTSSALAPATSPQLQHHASSGTDSVGQRNSPRVVPILRHADSAPTASTSSIYGGAPSLYPQQQPRQHPFSLSAALSVGGSGNTSSTASGRDSSGSVLRSAFPGPIQAAVIPPSLSLAPASPLNPGPLSGRRLVLPPLDAAVASQSVVGDSSPRFNRSAAGSRAALGRRESDQLRLERRIAAAYNEGPRDGSPADDDSDAAPASITSDMQQQHPSTLLRRTSPMPALLPRRASALGGAATAAAAAAHGSTVGHSRSRQLDVSGSSPTLRASAAPAAGDEQGIAHVDDEALQRGNAAS